MKTGIYSILNPYFSIIAIVLCFIPFTIVWWKKLTQERIFLLVGIYWLITALINIPQYIPAASANPKIEEYVTLIDNLIDTPLMLLIFYFSSSGVMKRIFLWLLIVFLVFESIMLIWKGNNFDSNTVIIGIGSFLTFVLCFIGLSRYFRKIEHDEEENALVFIYAGFTFLYGIFQIIWVFNYLHFKKETVAENQFIYYLSMILASLVTSIGLWRYARPRYQRAFKNYR